MKIDIDQAVHDVTDHLFNVTSDAIVHGDDNSTAYVFSSLASLAGVLLAQVSAGDEAYLNEGVERFTRQLRAAAEATETNILGALGSRH